MEGMDKNRRGVEVGLVGEPAGHYLLVIQKIAATARWF